MLIDEYQTREKNRAKAITIKRGVDVAITPIIDNLIDISDIDIEDNGIEIISYNGKNDKETFGATFSSYMYILSRDAQDLRFNSSDNNVSSKVDCMVSDDELVRVGSIIGITSTDIRYKVTRIRKKHSHSSVKIFELVKE